MSIPIEQEFKLRATDRLEIADVDAALHRIDLVVTRRERRVQTDVYLDDDAGSLRSAGVGLRVRSHGARRIITCKTRPRDNGRRIVRGEVNADWSPMQPPTNCDELPPPVRAVVLAAVRSNTTTAPAKLREVLTLTTTRELRWLATAGVERCELAIDAVEATAQQRHAHFAEIELEVLTDPAWCERIALALRDCLPVDFQTQDKPGHAAALLQLTGSDHFGVGKPPEAMGPA